MPQTKVRVTVTAATQESELFSVRQTADGSLIIILKSPKARLGVVSGSDVPEMSVSRLTIHPSKNSETQVHRINYHLTLANGSETELSSFIRRRHRHFRWIAYAMLCPNMAQPEFAPRSKANDITHNLGFYNPSTESLLYAIAVTDHGTPPFAGITNCFAFRMTHFQVVVYWMLNGGRSNHLSGIMIPSSNAPTVNKIQGEVIYPDTKAIRLREIDSLTKKIFEQLAWSHAEKTVALMATFPEFRQQDADAVMERCTIFLPSSSLVVR